MSSKALIVFRTPDQFATTLLAALLDAFREGEIDPILGDDEQRWSPETLLMEVEQEVGPIVAENFNRAMVAVELLSTNTFFHSLSDFIRICNLLAFSDAPDGFDPAECDEMGWAVTEAVLLLDGMWEPFSEEIVGYVKEMLTQEGFTSIPASLQTAFGDQLADFNPRFAFVDDPASYAAFQGVAQGNTEMVDAFVAEMMEKLQAQVSQTPFKTPVAKDWLTRMTAPAA